MRQQREELARELVRKDNQMKEMQQRLESGEGCKYTAAGASGGSRARSQTEPVAKRATFPAAAAKTAPWHAAARIGRVCSACSRHHRHPDVQITLPACFAPPSIPFA